MFWLMLGSSGTEWAWDDEDVNAGVVQYGAGVG